MVLVFAPASSKADTIPRCSETTAACKAVPLNSCSPGVFAISELGLAPVCSRALTILGSLRLLDRLVALQSCSLIPGSEWGLRALLRTAIGAAYSWTVRQCPYHVGSVGLVTPHPRHNCSTQRRRSSEHVTLEVECVDRLYCNLYHLLLQAPRGAVHYLRNVRGTRGSLAALIAPISRNFTAAIEVFADRKRIDPIRFVKGVRKDDRTPAYI